MAKINRQEVYYKCDGHCAYCGEPIEFKDMQIDHIIPKYSRATDEELRRIFNCDTIEDARARRGTDEIDNLNPACRTCNKWKDTFDLETFRDEIQKQLSRVKLKSANYRMALRYGLIQETPKRHIDFYFELTNKQNH